MLHTLKAVTATRIKGTQHLFDINTRLVIPLSILFSRIILVLLVYFWVNIK